MGGSGGGGKEDYLKAFKFFEKPGIEGHIHIDDLEHCMTHLGDKLSPEQWADMKKKACGVTHPDGDKKKYINYEAFLDYIMGGN
jgi:Ca2+-binding EF-hand superfamily protein